MHLCSYVELLTAKTLSLHLTYVLYFIVKEAMRGAGCLHKRARFLRHHLLHQFYSCSCWNTASVNNCALES